MHKLKFIIYYTVIVEKIQAKKGDFWPILVGFWGVCIDFWRGTITPAYLYSYN